MLNKFKLFFIISAYIITIYCNLSFYEELIAEPNYISIFGEQFRVIDNVGSKIYEISFRVRNNTDQHMFHMCFIPHLYNDFGEVFQTTSPSQSLQFCNAVQIGPGNADDITVQIADVNTIVNRIDIENALIMFSE